MQEVLRTWWQLAFYRIIPRTYWCWSVFGICRLLISRVFSKYLSSNLNLKASTAPFPKFTSNNARHLWKADLLLFFTITHPTAINIYRKFEYLSNHAAAIGEYWGSIIIIFPSITQHSTTKGGFWRKFTRVTRWFAFRRVNFTVVGPRYLRDNQDELICFSELSLALISL